MNDQFRICFKLVESFLELWLVRCVKQEFNRGIRSSKYKCRGEGGGVRGYLPTVFYL